MSWWGKIAGGTFGFMVGGPLGAMLGVAFGDYLVGGKANTRYGDSLGLGATERVQSAFFAATFSIMGYVAKSDGQVSKEEISMAEQVMRQMNLNPEQRSVAINLFNEGKKVDFSMQDVLFQFKRECFRRTNLIQVFLEILISTALADNELQKNEKKVLENIAQELGVSRSQFYTLLSRMEGFAHFDGSLSDGERIEAAHELLGLDKNCSEEELKKAYRKQMNQHHPDKLIAKGLPEEMIDVATEKTQDIKAAYELLKKNRN
ncbi:MAG: co-chaperone DjlA [Gammaproteobacteria bacterium]|nr:co-chaperone DjlA [Gammaproteobacteria bacterium]